MKKTIAIIATLAAWAGTASATDVFYETVNAGSGNNRGNGYYGWCLQLNNTVQLTTTCGTEVAQIPASVTLDTVTFKSRDTYAASPAWGDAKIAVYEYTADRTTGAFVGLSTNSTGAYVQDKEYGMEFTGITLDTTKRYQFLFVGASATVDNLASFDGYKENAQGMSLTLVNNAAGQNIPSGWGTYSNNTLSGWAAQLMPVLNIGTHVTQTDPVVPEPATGTLSLLALAGLCARRRRK